MTALAPDPAGYLQALEERLAQLPASQRRMRSTHLEAFLRRGFPTTRQEAWRYTDLSALAGSRYESAGAVDDEALRSELEGWFLPDADRLVFINGRYSPTLSASTGTALLSQLQAAEPLEPFEAEPLSQLNVALASDGAVLRVPAGVRHPRPIQILTYAVPSATPSMVHLAHRLCLEPGAEANVIVHNLGRSGGSQFLTQTVITRVLAGAHLDLSRVQVEGDGQQAISRWDCVVERNARLHFVNVDMGGALVRNDLNVRLDGPGAEVGLHGLFAPAPRSHVDNHARIEHRAPQGTSRQVYRGIVPERAKAVFNGRVVVQRDAQKTDSDQQIASLLLGPGAEVNAKPELEINADDVKCAHGATAGQVDDAAIYYLRSRGIAEDVARNLLLYTFAHEVLARIAYEPLRRQTERQLVARLPGGIDLDALA